MEFAIKHALEVFEPKHPFIHNFSGRLVAYDDNGILIEGQGKPKYFTSTQVKEIKKWPLFQFMPIGPLGYKNRHSYEVSDADFLLLKEKIIKRSKSADTSNKPSEDSSMTSSLSSESLKQNTNSLKLSSSL